MTIQGTQVPIYTNTLFLYFSDFSIFFLFEKQNEAKLKNNQTKHVKQDKSMHKTRLTQNNKAKHTSNAKQKNKKGRERISDRITWSHFSFHTLEKPFCLANPWSGSEGEELKPFKFERNIRAIRRSPKGAKEDGNWFWSHDTIMLLLFWVAKHL